MFKCALLFSLALAAPSLAGIVSYEGNSFPEHVGWERSDRPHLADRWIQDGWFVQYAEIVDPGPPEIPEDDYYLRYIADFAGASTFFVEWRMETNGPREGIPAVAPAALVVSGRFDVMYHFTIADDQVRLIDSDLSVLLIDIEAGVPHTYRLELYGEELYRWFIDGQMVDSGVPAGPYPTSDSVIGFGARAAGCTIMAQWNYIRFGVIPVNGSGDYDSNAQIDLSDFYFFHECLTNRRPGINGGPGNDAGPGCRFADFDSDSDVDLLDYAEFQLNFTGDK